MTYDRWALLAAAVSSLAASGPAFARTHANAYNAHCTPDPIAPDPAAAAADRQVRCLIEDPGRYDIDAEALFKNGGPIASAELFITLDGRACGKSELVQFTGRGSVFTGCQRRKLDGDRHEVLLRVVYHMADYDDLHVTVVRRPFAPSGAGRPRRP